MTINLFFIFFLVPLLENKAETARILAVVPTPSFSHQVFYRPLWQELANRGHHLVLVTTDPMNDTPQNLHQIDVSIGYDYKNRTTVADIMKVGKANAISIMVNMFCDATRLIFSHNEVTQLFKNKEEQFDLLMLECVFPSVYSFMYRFDVPMICLTSLDAHVELHDLLGNPTHHILYPNYLLPFGEEMNFLERSLTVVAMTALDLYMKMSIFPKVAKILEESLDEEMPDLLGQGEKIDLLFTNSNPLFNTMRPISPATISIAGGLHETTLKPLPKDLQEFLDKASEGAIYFSLGSNVKSKDMEEQTRQVITETFRQLSYKVLWKFEDHDLPNKPQNVRISKWVPQQDVLRHKNVKVFVTQAGMQSLEESLYARVPMVAIPYFGDQEANAKRMAAKGLGLYLDHSTLTVDSFKTALIEVMRNDKYRKKVEAVAEMIQDQPMKPLQKAVWWTEYVIRHKGAQHLKGPRIPVWQYYYLDVLAFIVVLFGVIVIICVKVSRMMLNFACGKLFRCRSHVKNVQIQSIQNENNKGRLKRKND